MWVCRGDSQIECDGAEAAPIQMLSARCSYALVHCCAGMCQKDRPASAAVASPGRGINHDNRVKPPKKFSRDKFMHVMMAQLEVILAKRNHV